MGDHHEAETVRCCPSVRLSMAVLMFFGTFVLYMNRVNISVAIVCMTDGQSLAPPNITRASSVQNSYHFDWTKSQQGIILSSFFMGYTLTQIPTGWVIPWVNVKWVEFAGIALTALASVLSPLAATWHWGCLVGLQVIKGLACGTFYPCQQSIVSHWSPPKERTAFSALSMSGASLGNVVSFALSGYLCEEGFAGGWPSIFYVYALVSGVWLVAWALFAYDTPAEHSCISRAEKMYVEHSLRGQISSSTGEDVPWCALLSSLPFWSVVIVDFSYSWIWYTALTSLPTYFSEVLHFDITRNGLLNSLPYLVYLFVGLFGSMLVDMIAFHQKSVTRLRKVIVGIELLVPGAFIVAVGFTEDRDWAVVLLTFAVGVLGLCRAGHFVNMIEIAPSFAGQTMSVCNTVSNVSGILAPVFTSLLTPDGTQAEWRYVFVLAAALNSVAAIIYFIFGRGDLQRWARVHDDEGRGTPSSDEP